MELYGDYRYEIAEGREATYLEATQSQTREKKSVPTKDKKDVRPIAKPVTVSSNTGGTDITKHNKTRATAARTGLAKTMK